MEKSNDFNNSSAVASVAGSEKFVALYAFMHWVFEWLPGGKINEGIERLSCKIFGDPNAESTSLAVYKSAVAIAVSLALLMTSIATSDKSVEDILSSHMCYIWITWAVLPTTILMVVTEIFGLQDFFRKLRKALYKNEESVEEGRRKLAKFSLTFNTLIILACFFTLPFTIFLLALDSHGETIDDMLSFVSFFLYGAFGIQKVDMNYVEQ